MRLRDILRQLRTARSGGENPTLGLTPPQLRQFEDEGYVILRGAFSPTAVAALRDHLDWLWDHRQEQGDLPIDIYFDTPEEARIFFRKAPEQARQSPYKILDLHLQDELVRQACTEPRLMGAVAGALGAHPLVCNTLLFEWGSQQYPHFDTFFMPSKTKNMMAASWLALDRVTEANGPVYYYPGSHKIDPFVFSHGKTTAIFSELKTSAADHIARIVDEYGLKQTFFLADPGDVLIWHAQLLHGGAAIHDRSLRRRSLVTHYWTQVDYPSPDQRADLGEGRWLLKRDHQFVVDEDILAEVDVALSTMRVPEDVRSRVPGSFDARRYLARNQDVLRAGVDPWTHYLEHGQAEGRVW
jgi:ectoine hydroxylase-related dioxygenase (phytanoyl-CoA dioxygenase family)